MKKLILALAVTLAFGLGSLTSSFAHSDPHPSIKGHVHHKSKLFQSLNGNMTEACAGQCYCPGTNKPKK